MLEETLSIIACPLCGNDLMLDVKKRKKERVWTGMLTCKKCGNNYPIIEGIPDLNLPRAGGKITSKHIQVEKYYDHYAAVHDINYHNPELYYMRKVEDHMILLSKPRGNVVDIGCGTGRQTLFLASMNCKVYAVDISRKMLLTARRKAYSLDLQNSIEFIQASADYLPFQEGVFDRAYSIFGAYNHALNYKEGFNRLGKIIKKGGRTVISVLNQYRLTWWLYSISTFKTNWIKKALKSRQTYLRLRVGRRKYRAWTHLYTFNELKQLLRTAGFRRVYVGSILIFFKPEFKYASQTELKGIKYLLGKVEDKLRWVPPFNGLGTYLIAWAKK
ncbi:MAG: methyltransferase domain-containing protein [Candidatus Baldrarchaeia archaeon]